MDLTHIFSSSTPISTFLTEDAGNEPYTEYFGDAENETDTEFSTLGLGPRPYLVFLFLTLTSLSTIIGNGLVVISIWRENGLHSPTNYFIASLATADLFVGGVVIPFEAFTELLGNRWLFGAFW